MSGMPSEFVKRSAVAEVLGLDHAEVDRLIEEDGLPAIKLPGLKYTKIRIHLPDLHRWLLIGCRNSNPRLRDYEAFRAAFRRKKCRVSSEQ